MRGGKLATLSAMVVLVLGFTSAHSALAIGTEVRSGILRVDTAIGRVCGDGYASPRVDSRSGHQGAASLESQGEKRVEAALTRGRSAPDRARQMLESPRGSKVLAHCRARGMFELPEQAFAISGRGSPSPGARGFDSDSGSDFLIAPMSDPRGDRFATAMVCREDDGDVMAITIDTATNELTDVISPDGERELTKFDKKKWADCFLTVCGPCIAGCAFTGPLWLKCSAACCGVAAAVCVYIAMQE